MALRNLAAKWAKAGPDFGQWGMTLLRGLFVAVILLVVDIAPGRAAADAEIDAAWLESAFPGAAWVGPSDGSPPTRKVTRPDGEVAGYILSTQNVVRSKGFSGKPMDILVAVDTDGIIRGVRILEHHEPILVIGVSDADLTAFVEQYIGLDIRSPVSVIEVSGATAPAIDAVTGATVSSIVINDTILRAARAVAMSRGLLGAQGLVLEEYSAADWDALFADGSLVPLRVSVGEAQKRLAEQGGRLFPEGVTAPPAETALIEIAFGLATPARVGQNLLGQKAYNRETADLAAGDHLIFVGGSGAMSFKGTAYIRSGVFDRVQIVQGDRSFPLHREDYRRIADLAVGGAPVLRDLALFRVEGGRGFDPGMPWRLELLVPAGEPSETDIRAVFAGAYSLPDRYRRSDVPPDFADSAPLWQVLWSGRQTEIAVLAVALTVLLLALLFQDWVVRRQRLYTWFRVGFLVFTLVWLGWIMGAQLSVLNVLTFLEAVRTGFTWDTFLLEPLIFILWGLVAVTMLFWARGVFCGWLCPFGALQELTNRLAAWLKVPQLQIPAAVHERLVALKYVIFLVIFGLSLGATPLAQSAAEIEPFKTAIILKFDRNWPFVLYAVTILGAGLFVPRVFCRYLCPLGAALALPARLHMFRWLRRRSECGNPCQQCAVTCPVQAIQPRGAINPAECIHCLHCQAYYYDEEVCPPLLRQRKLSQRLAAAGD
ncbi:MAG: regulatory protein NosR [Alphaproteobacteria bacterium]|nr:regulatory protein NosR [Alphaproteobacteria bacterium]